MTECCFRGATGDREHGWAWPELLQMVDRLSATRLLVVGDVMLDSYVYGSANRVSPEGPIVVLQAERQEDRLGGAASVAWLATALGAQVECVGVIGDDTSGRRLQELAERQHVTLHALPVGHRPTTVKTRFVGQAAGHGWQHMLRVDQERVGPLTAEEERRLWLLVSERLADCQGVLISDYGKGVCSPALLDKLISGARQQGVPVLVDPSRGADYARYRGATLLKPNRSQAATAVGRPINTVPVALQGAAQLAGTWCLDAVVITLDRDGLVWYDRHSGATAHVPAVVREVCDITGAGDAVLAALGVFYSNRVPLPQAAVLANVVAGCQVEHLGVTPVSLAELRSHLLRRAHPTEKIVTLEQATQLAEQYRRQQKRVVFTNGCYDLLHAGHVLSLASAANEGDVLFVGVNSDHSVRKLKGPHRPIIGELDRLTMVAALECVDHVILFHEETPHALLHAIRPHVLVKGGTYRPEEVVGREVVESYGGIVRVTPMVEGLSTTKILDRILQRPAA